MKTLSLLTLIMITVSIVRAQDRIIRNVIFENKNENLAAYYPFNGNANDESGNGHNGVAIGATLTHDRFGNANSAYFFDGIDDVIALEANLYDGNIITISAWIKKLGSGNDYWSSIVAGDCGTPYFGFGGDSPTFGGQCDSPMFHQFEDYELTDTLWHFMVGVYDGHYIKLYLDDQQIINQDVGEYNFDNTLPIGIGGSYQHWRSLECFYGMIDEVSIFSSSITHLNVNKECVNVNIYPNPSDGMLNIEFENMIRAKIEVYNVMDKLLFRKVSDSKIEKIDVSDYPAGIYLIKVESQSKKVYVGKFVMK